MSLQYGPEFPQEINLPAYQQLTGVYHAIKSKWAEFDLLDSLGEQLNRASATEKSWQRGLPSILESPEIAKLLKNHGAKEE